MPLYRQFTALRGTSLVMPNDDTTAAYLEEILRNLASIAKRAKYPVLSVLIGIAALQAAQIQKSTEEDTRDTVELSEHPDARRQ